MRKRGPLEIDVIIVSDYYGSLATGKIIERDGPIAMNNKFGWLLSGRVGQAGTDFAETHCYRTEVLSCFMVNFIRRDSTFLCP